MLRIRELERRDLEVVRSWHNNRELSKMLAGGGFHFVGEEVDDLWFERYLDSRDTQVRCVVVDECDRVLCCVYLVDIDTTSNKAELHIMIGDAENRGKGIGTFAVGEMVRHAFIDLNLNRLELEVLSGNKVAQRLYEKFGFQVEGIKRQAVWKDGAYRDVVDMGLLREDTSDNDEG